MDMTPHEVIGLGSLLVATVAEQFAACLDVDQLPVVVPSRTSANDCDHSVTTWPVLRPDRVIYLDFRGVEGGT